MTDSKKTGIRTLAAIMFTDMVGYTALMQQDEDEAIFKRNKLREVLQNTTQEYGGKILQHFGDGSLIIFSSTVEAVKSAVRIQELLQEAPSVPLRIGIHAGDVVYNDEGIYGDGVNVASRIESFGVPGAVLISDKVYHELQSHPELPAMLLGKFELKHVRHHMEIYAIMKDTLYVPHPNELSGKGKLLHNSIAVMPFVNMSADPENEYFSDGITEEILNALTRINDLKVTARTSSFAFKGKNVDVREIARQLNVSMVLEGSVRKHGHRVRITAQLINASDGYHFWSETFDGSLEDVFALQDEISEQIAQKLLICVQSNKQPSSIANSSNTNELRAYEYYLKGKYYWNLWTPQDVKKAVNFFEKAIRLAPNLLQPYVGLCNSYVYLGTTGQISPQQATIEAKKAANKAIDLHPDHVESLQAMAMVKMFFDWDFQGAKELFKRGLEINPGVADLNHCYAIFLMITGNQALALYHNQKAIELDPLNLPVNMMKAEIYYYARDYEKSLEQCEKIIAMAPTFRRAIEHKGWVLSSMGRHDEAIEVMHQLYYLTESPYRGSSQLAFTYARAGKTSEAIKWLNMVKERETHEPDVNLDIDFAAIYMSLGDLDIAMNYIEKAADKKMGVMVYLATTPHWGHLHDHPRFKKVMEKVGLHQYIEEQKKVLT
ncbi:adenylate/guanylate cyclase domain-containing protein [Limibacter armeniacum]|uniref:adenylate/guanylate cyclase domain-containing protein n=1 Tax=Limibacter armeniacum TaxID=466084 RepID=UPI002FE545B7